MNKIPGQVLCDQCYTLSIIDLRNLSQTCKQFYSTVKNDQLWKAKFIFNYGTVDVSWVPEESYFELYKKTLQETIFVIEFRFIESLNSTDDGYNRYNIIKTGRVLIGRDHLEGLVTIAYIHQKYLFTLGQTTKFEFMKVRSIDAKDKEERLWQERANMASEQHKQVFEIFDQVDTILGSDKIRPSLDFSTVGSGFGPYNYEHFESKPDREDRFGNLDTLINNWANICSRGDIVGSLDIDRGFPEVNTEDSVSSQIRKFHIYYTHLTKQFTCVLRFPNLMRWVSINFSDYNSLNGIKLGCKILDLNPKDWLSFVFRVQVSSLDVSQL